MGEEAFSVTLRFGGAPERLHVPFAALVAFADPQAQFGLHFERIEEVEAKDVARPEQGAPPVPKDAEPEPAGAPAAGNVVDIRAFRRRDDQG